LIGAVWILSGGCSLFEVEKPDKYLEGEVLRFFGSLKEKVIHDTYLSTHPQFREKTSLRDFSWLNKVYGLNQHQGFTTESIRYQKKLAEVSGILDLSDGSPLPVSLRLIPIKAPAEWKIIHLSFDLRKYVESQGMVEPGLTEMNSIARRSLTLFQDSIRRYQMDSFYQPISRIWKASITLQEMNDHYARYMRDPFLSEDFSDGNLVLQASSGVREDGILNLKGRVVSNLNLIFDSDYFFENGRWNLIRFEIELE